MPEIKKRLPKNSTKFQKILLKKPTINGHRGVDNRRIKVLLSDGRVMQGAVMLHKQRDVLEPQE